MSSLPILQPPASERLIGITVAARILNVSERTLRYWALHGMLPAIRVGKLWKFSRRQIAEFAAGGRVAA